MNQELNTQIVQEVPKKKGKAGIIVLILIILVLIGVGGWFLFTKVLDKEEKKEDTKTEEKKKEDKKGEEKKEDKKLDSSYNGIYEKDGIQLSIFTIDGKIEFFYEGATSVSSYAELKGNVAKEDYGKRTFTFKDGEVVVEDSNDEYNIAGTYKKVKDYTIEDYYEYTIGDPKVFNSKYNGKYTSDKYTMYIYQIGDDKCRVTINGDFGVFDIEFDIKEDGSLYETFFDDEYSITFDGDKAIFKTVKTDDENKKEKDGTYTKTGSVTMEEAILASR